MSELVKRYLKGHFQNMYEEDNLTFVKQISMFYAVDRVATMIKRDFSLKLSNIELLNRGFNIICNRYTTSNMLHMSANLTDQNNITEYIDWLIKIEYAELGLPSPDMVLYLDVNPEISIQNMKERYYDQLDKFDIHENLNHLNRVFDIKDFVIKYNWWFKINCMNSNNKIMKSIEDINDILYNRVKEIL
jgi:dTMP kinase